MEDGDPLAILDLDHFKVVNDTLGHHRGDEVLQELGAFLRDAIRDGDGVARYGGEEFVVVLRQLPSGALEVIERLLADWRASTPPATLSAGIAVKHRAIVEHHLFRRLTRRCTKQRKPGAIGRCSTAVSRGLVATSRSDEVTKRVEPGIVNGRSASRPEPSKVGENMATASNAHPDQLRSLADGRMIPVLGLGVWQVRNGRTCVNAVRWALELGYRHIDTAQAYRNEESVGRALKDSGIPRDEVFITTKFYPGGKDPAAEAAMSLKRLGVDYVDLYLVHWPQGGPTWAWPGMERAHTLGYRDRSVSRTSVLPSWTRWQRWPRLLLS